MLSEMEIRYLTGYMQNSYSKNYKSVIKNRIIEKLDKLVREISIILDNSHKLMGKKENKVQKFIQNISVLGNECLLDYLKKYFKENEELKKELDRAFFYYKIKEDN